MTAYRPNMSQDYVIERHNNEPPILLPKALISAWKVAYGTDDLAKTILEIERAISDIDRSRSRKELARDDIPKEFYNHIHNKDFFRKDLGSFIQAAILVGHEIDPLKYFNGSGAVWDGESRVHVISVAFIERERHNRPNSMLLQVEYQGLSLNLVNDAIGICRILY